MAPRRQRRSDTTDSSVEKGLEVGRSARWSRRAAARSRRAGSPVPRVVAAHLESVPGRFGGRGRLAGDLGGAARPRGGSFVVVALGPRPGRFVPRYGVDLGGLPGARIGRVLFDVGVCFGGPELRSASDISLAAHHCDVSRGNDREATATVTWCGCRRGEPFEGFEPRRGERARPGKRDEPQDRLRGATNPRVGARRKPSRWWETTRAERARRVAAPGRRGTRLPGVDAHR